MTIRSSSSLRASCMRGLPCILLACLLLAAGGVQAQAQQQPQAPAQDPPKLEPLPDLPAAPEAATEDLEAAVRIRKDRGDKIEVSRRGGQIKAIKVTPANGAPPYYLIDRQGNGKFAIYDGPISGLVFPSWTVLEW
jgi:hypothetical protein